MQVNPDVGSMDAVLDKLYGKVGTNKSIVMTFPSVRMGGDEFELKR